MKYQLNSFIPKIKASISSLTAVTTETQRVHEFSYMYIYIYIYISLISRVFANDPGDRCSIPGRVIPKTKKMVFDAALLNTQNYKVGIKGKVEQSREKISALSNILV